MGDAPQGPGQVSCSRGERWEFAKLISKAHLHIEKERILLFEPRKQVHALSRYEKHPEIDLQIVPWAIADFWYPRDPMVINNILKPVRRKNQGERQDLQFVVEETLFQPDEQIVIQAVHSYLAIETVYILDIGIEAVPETVICSEDASYIGDLLYSG